MMTATVLIGDCRDVLPTLPDRSVQMCVTSPPYFGLRSYLNNGHESKHAEIGAEPTPEAYVDALVQVFREVRRVLVDDGTLWLNLGDSYNSGPTNGSRPGSGRADGIVDDRAQRNRNGTHAPGLKPKDLIGIPWMVAFALRADGWWLRMDHIWHKPNGMPESVQDRCTRNHEYLFLFTKSARYYYDAAAIAEPGVEPDRKRNDRSGGANGHKVRHSAGGMIGATEMRNKRSVWTVPTIPYADAHFATFPPALITPCILAGSREGDTVLDPFGGSGTTGEVSTKLGRHSILIELNAEYKPMIAKRTAQQNLFLGVE